MPESPSFFPPYSSPPLLQVLIPSVKLDYSHVQSRCGSLDRRGYSAGGGNVSLVPQIHCLSVDVSVIPVCCVMLFSVAFSFSTLLYSISVYHPLTEAAMLVLLPNWSSLTQLPLVVVCVQQRILRLMVECLLSSTWQCEGVLQLSDNRDSITLRQLNLISWLCITESSE